MNEKYEIEVWSKAGQPMGNISKLCSEFSYKRTRNDKDEIKFTINLTKLDEYTKKIGYSDSLNFLDILKNDIRVKRYGKYKAAGNVVKFKYKTQQTSVFMEVEVDGYLNFYRTQFATFNYTNTNMEDIMWGVIAQCNTKNGGDYGIRRGTHTGASFKHNANDKEKEVKSFLQQKSAFANSCDFEFTPDKLFNTYEMQGVYRPNVRLVYPGNINGFDGFERDGRDVTNFLYAKGSGNGDDAIQLTAEDATSQNEVYRREAMASWNSVTQLLTLQDHAEAYIAESREVLELPTVTLKPGSIDLDVINIGDSISLEFKEPNALTHINGIYRIESIDVNVTQNGTENVTIQFDNLDIDSIISKQETE